MLLPETHRVQKNLLTYGETARHFNGSWSWKYYSESKYSVVLLSLFFFFVFNIYLQ